MNKQIQLLAEQAGFKADRLGHLFGGDDIEKFAKLIVRECARVANLTEGDEGDDYQSGRTWAGIDVLKHFGVEE